MLFIGSENHSGGLYFSTRGRDVSLIFVDGAWAALVCREVDSSKGILSSHLHSEGKYAEELSLIGPSTNRWVPEILKANGKNVHKTQIINDRGIHICKSIVAWLKFGENSSPKDTSEKGDVFVGKYYVLFDEIYKKEISKLINEGNEKDYAEKNAPIFLEAQDLLIKWEKGDKEVIDLWKK